MLRDVSAKNCRAAEHPISLVTANGLTEANEVADVKLSALPDPVQPCVLDHTPAVLSVGTRCVDQGYSFVWPANGKPILVRPDDKVVQLKMEGHVPVLDDTCKVYSKEQFQKDKHLKNCSQCRPRSRAPKPSAMTLRTMSNWTNWLRMMPSRNISEVARLRIFRPRLQALIINMHIHFPKNPFCRTCHRARMMAPQARKKGGQKRIETEAFGDHIIGDHVITKKNVEDGFKGEQVALVLKDLHTQYRYVYPSQTKDAQSSIWMVWIISLGQKMMFKLCTLTTRLSWLEPSRTWDTDIRPQLNMLIHQSRLQSARFARCWKAPEATCSSQDFRWRCGPLPCSSMQPRSMQAPSLKAVNHHGSSGLVKSSLQCTSRLVPKCCFGITPKGLTTPQVSFPQHQMKEFSLGITYYIQPGHDWKGEYLVAKLEAADYHVNWGALWLSKEQRGWNCHPRVSSFLWKLWLTRRRPKPIALKIRWFRRLPRSCLLKPVCVRHRRNRNMSRARLYQPTLMSSQAHPKNPYSPILYWPPKVK